MNKWIENQNEGWRETSARDGIADKMLNHGTIYHDTDKDVEIFGRIRGNMQKAHLDYSSVTKKHRPHLKTCTQDFNGTQAFMNPKVDFGCEDIHDVWNNDDDGDISSKMYELYPDGVYSRVNYHDNLQTLSELIQDLWSDDKKIVVSSLQNIQVLCSYQNENYKSNREEFSKIRGYTMLSSVFQKWRDNFSIQVAACRTLGYCLTGGSSHDRINAYHAGALDGAMLAVHNFHLDQKRFQYFQMEHEDDILIFQHLKQMHSMSQSWSAHKEDESIHQEPSLIISWPQPRVGGDLESIPTTIQCIRNIDSQRSGSKRGNENESLVAPFRFPLVDVFDFDQLACNDNDAEVYALLDTLGSFCHPYMNTAIEENRAILASNGGFERVVEVMSKWIGNPSIQAASCRVLSNNIFTMSSQDRNMVINKEVFEIVIQAMANHPMNNHVQINGTIVLCHIGTNECLCSGYEVVTKALQQFQYDEEMQQYGCHFLYMLSNQQEKSGIQCTDNDPSVPLMLLAAMKSFPKSNDIQRLGCAGLQRYYETNPDSPVTIGEIHAVISAMKYHQEAHDIQVFGEAFISQTVQRDDVNRKTLIFLLNAMDNSM